MKKFSKNLSIPFLSVLLLFGLANSPCVQAKIPKDQILNMTATQALEALRSGQLKALDYVNAVLEQVEQTRDLNAFISLDPAGARKAAAKIDELRVAGTSLPILAGLPIIVKDNIDTKDLPTTAGTLGLQNNYPLENAPSVQKLLDKGAILIGKTNMHELALGLTSTNTTRFPQGSGLTAGAVKNPYDLTKIPGGSSGGTAAAIAARVVPAGLGTDTGGSTRVPAALTGIAGFRPSVGNGGKDRRYQDDNKTVPISVVLDTVGVMARTVEDIALLDAAITDAAPLTSTSLKGVRIGLPNTHWANLDPQLKSIAEMAKAKLEAAGVVFVEVDTSAFPPLMEKIGLPLALQGAHFDLPIYFKKHLGAVKSLEALASQVSSPDVQGLTKAIVRGSLETSYKEVIENDRPSLQKNYQTIWQTYKVDALFFPTTPIAATPIDTEHGSGPVLLNGVPTEAFLVYTRNTYATAAAGLPGVSIPVSLTQEGLPVGVELDGPLGSDRYLLSLAMAIEQLFSPLPAPTFKSLSQ
ncbi:MAG: amidase [Ottowia sp.]|nr:amidase [Ottowia sp.]